MRLFGENLTLDDIMSLRGLYLVGMGFGVGLTGYSLAKGVIEATDNVILALVGTMIMMIFLLVLSMSVTGSITDRKWVLSIFTGSALAGLVGVISFFSFSYWYDVVGETNGKI